MIKGVGIDLVNVERFNAWATFSRDRLLKTFTHHEVDYSLSERELASDRFAARFAAKEAFFKALCSYLGMMPCQLSLILSSVEVLQEPNRAPILRLDYTKLNQLIEPNSLPDLYAHLSISHEKGLAIAFVVLEASDR